MTSRKNINTNDMFLWNLNSYISDTKNLKQKLDIYSPSQNLTELLSGQEIYTDSSKTIQKQQQKYFRNEILEYRRDIKSTHDAYAQILKKSKSLSKMKKTKYSEKIQLYKLISNVSNILFHYRDALNQMDQYGHIAKSAS